MEIEYAYCNHCGAEYNEKTFLPYVRTTASGDLLRCKECEHEIHTFVKVDDEETP